MILFYLCPRKCDFELPRFDTVAYGRHSLHYQGPFIWSKVSSELRNLTSLKAFKKHIRGVDLLSHVQCSPYQAVTGKIYRLKQHFLPPAPAKKYASCDPIRSPRESE